jgi:hypothetical protein
MKRFWITIAAAAALLAAADPAPADNAAILKEIEALKERIAELEQRLEEQEAAAKKQAAKSEKETDEKIGAALEERFGTLAVHGGAVLYVQESRAGKLNGGSGDDPGGAGFAADLEFTWKPALPVVEDGEFFVRVHAGNGTGADRGGRGRAPADLLLANLNTIADDNSDEESDSGIRLLEAHYTHPFLDGRLSVTAGKAEPLAFLDDNAFANDEVRQFVGKPFVNNSVLDGENEYTPLLGVKFQPTELVALALVGASTSRPLVEDSPLDGDSKSKYDNLFSTPFLGGQVALMPKFGERQGNYRLYGWTASYDHAELDRRRDYRADGQGKGWGLGLSADQEIAEGIGLFGRAAWNNEEVYIVKYELSGGVNLKGLLPDREDDEIGLGLAALFPDSRYQADDPEIHLELYYRIAVTENFAITPDLQIVWNPGGDRDNGEVAAGMLRGEFSF